MSGPRASALRFARIIGIVLILASAFGLRSAGADPVPSAPDGPRLDPGSEVDPFVVRTGILSVMI